MISMNGGAAWNTLHTGTTDILNSIQFPVDATTGYVVGAAGTIR